MAEPIDYMTAQGWLKDGERRLLHDLAAQTENQRDAVFINIGVEYGASLACLRAGNPRAEIYGIDLDLSKVLADGYGATTYEGNSADFVDAWKKEPHSGPVDLVFVDGDHGYIGVTKDAELADFVKVGGYILFQDAYDWIEIGQVHRLVPGVNAAVTDWFEGHRDEFEELPFVDTTRIFKRVKKHEFAGSSGGNTHVQSRATSDNKPRTASAKPEVQRANKPGGGRRQR